MAAIGALRDALTGRTLVPRVVRADGWIARTIGFLGRREIADDEALWFDGCSGVHTMGMRVAIDVIFLDGDNRVVDVARDVKPWRAWVGRKGARAVLETAAGASSKAGIGAGTAVTIAWN